MSNVAHSTGEQSRAGWLPITAVPGTSYTPDLQDRLNLIQLNSASTTTVTLPADVDVPFPVGTLLQFLRSGAGAVNIAGGSGAAVNKGASHAASILEQHALAMALKTAANTWLIFGALTAA